MKQIFTYMILIIFLIVRYSSGHLFTNFSDIDSLALAKSVLIFSIYASMLLTIWVNKNTLSEFNIDNSYFFILLGYCLFLSWTYFPLMLSVLSVVFIWVLNLEYQKYKYTFSKPTFFSWHVFGLTLCLLFLPILFSNHSREAKNISDQVTSALLNANLFGVIFEEFLFRGLLWSVLTNRGLTKSGVVLFQAVLFWFAHYQLLLEGRLSFWITVPLGSIILGVLVLRSKSLTVSTLSHFLYNFLVNFL